MRGESTRTIPLTDEHREKIEALSHVTMVVTWDKQFTRHLARVPDAYLLSPKQVEHLDRLYHRYRGQIAPQAENAGETHRLRPISLVSACTTA